MPSKLTTVINNQRQCTTCLEWKDLERFPLNKATSTGRNPSCKDCVNAYKRNKYLTDEGHRQQIAKATREWNLNSKYNITIEDYNILVKQQNNKCAICEDTFSATRGHRPHVDHCHVTGKVRGLLCPHCNMALGNFFDNEDILMNAITYLKNSR